MTTMARKKQPAHTGQRILESLGRALGKPAITESGKMGAATSWIAATASESDTPGARLNEIVTQPGTGRYG